MIKQQITIKEVIDFLNELVELDNAAIESLINSRVNCNKAMADHPTVQVRQWPSEEGFEVGLLGVLNGMFGVNEDGWGGIVAIWR